MQNIEIKTPIDDPEAVVARITALDGAAPVWTRRQTDTFFRVPAGYLKLRVEDGTRAELIAYLRAPGTEPRPSDYDIAPVGDPEGLSAVLGRSLGVRGTVEKTRTLYLWKHTRIHLDEVAGLGTFLELETVVEGITREEARIEAGHLIETLGLQPARFLGRPYLELLEDRR